MGKFWLPPVLLRTGLIAGALDLTAACLDVRINADKSPVWLLQNVAGALLGPATYEGGAATAALGFVMHFTVAFAWTTLFYLLSQRFPLLLRQSIISGMVFGAVVFLAMYRVVIPLTIELRSLYLTQPFNHNWPKLRGSQFLVHLLCIGLPISLLIRRDSTRPGNAANL